MLANSVSLKALIFYLFLASFALKAQTDSLCIKSAVILKMTEDYHFAAPVQDSAFSALIYDKFITKLSGGLAFFTQEDLSELESWRYKLVDDKQAPCDLKAKAVSVYSTRMQALLALLAAESKQAPSINEATFYESKSDGNYANESEWKQHWQSYLKLRVLWAVYEDSIANPSTEVLKDWKYRVCQNISCRIQNQVDNFEAIETFVEEQYLRSLCNAIDPHTSYFNRFDMQSFERSLSRNALSYGFEIYRNQSGEIEIYKIIPGSPAWKSNQLNEGDILLGAANTAIEGEDFSCMPMADILKMVEGEDTIRTDFKVRKKSGETIEISLPKEKLAVEENLIEAYILEGDQKVGYIYLPSFYESEETYSSGRGCAVDVSNALIRLKREGVEALIFDLRNNGGGAMYEALRLAGIFVDYGALSIYSNGAEVQTLKDMDRGYIFGKPMVVLVNSYSASASELFASALQDRNRAVIVGSPTYGKSTAQNIVPLLSYRGRDTTVIPASYMKLTTGAFFRVTGETHQKEGVIPDINLPNTVDFSDARESSEVSALDFDAVKKKTYYFPAKALPIEDLAAKSRARLEQDSSWQVLLEQDLELEESYKIPLRYEDFKDYMEADEQTLFADHASKLPYKVSSLKLMFSYQPEEDEQGEASRKSIERDPYISESYFILKDLIQSNNK